MKKSRRNQAGETIAEVMISMVLFLLMVAMLQISVSFCRKAQEKSSQIRYNASEAAAALRDGNVDVESEETKYYQFYAVGADGTRGEDVFGVKTVLRKETAKYKTMENEDKKTTFYVYD